MAQGRRRQLRLRRSQFACRELKSVFFLRRSVPPEEFYQRGSALSAGAAQEMMGKEREESED